MITSEQRAHIRRLFYAEHFKVGTIAANLGLHHDTVKRAIEVDRFVSNGRVIPSRLDPYLPFITETLATFPRLRATRLHEMLAARGYTGSVVQVRRVVSRLRPAPAAKAYLHLSTLPGEQAQVDWGNFGHVMVGRAKRPLSVFVMVLSWSRAIHALFTLDQTLESFLRGHVAAFDYFGGAPRVVLYDNLKAAVLNRYGDTFHFQPRLLELCSHYHFMPRPVGVARGNEKGKVERQIRFLRERFFAARSYRDVDDLNVQFVAWRDAWAHRRPCPGDDSISVATALEREQPVLLPLPEHPFSCDKLMPVMSAKTTYVRFDLNHYSIPHDLVRRPLTLVASAREVRIINGAVVVARHERSYDRGRYIEDPDHIARLVAWKRKARETKGRDRLTAAVPQVAVLLGELVNRGHDLASAARQLGHLLDDYGPEELATAIDEALARGTPAPTSVAHILERRMRARRQLPRIRLDLPDNPKVRDLAVTPHNLETYDALSRQEPHEQAGAPDRPQDPQPPRPGTQSR